MGGHFGPLSGHLGPLGCPLGPLECHNQVQAAAAYDALSTNMEFRLPDGVENQHLRASKKLLCLKSSICSTDDFCLARLLVTNFSL